MSPKAICTDCKKELAADTFSALEELEIQHHVASKRNNDHQCRGFMIYTQDERNDGSLRGDNCLGFDTLSHGLFFNKAPRPKS